ncbi:SRPBCC domain-containing protein [Aestuariibacter sp. AA17]|uniref:SRPBCC domain-containing protein n=1 Tax=Fluctibacter corallii TaxID=2984329 RepID=A0ABT3A5M5_9ALTE|nr:SRPBCC domain-containing protein [Aestuariibacter sp. AA17]MCV2883980.1 SRPBCC domain-containing protein [Aestuariibacter sp. AA17]
MRKSCGLSLWISAILLTMLPFAHAEVKWTQPHGFKIVNKAVINAPPETVWYDFVNNIDAWWPKDHSWWGEKGTFSLTPKAGGCFCEVSGDNSAEHMRVVFVAKETQLTMVGGLGPLQGMGMYGALNWQFNPKETGTEVTLTYTVQGADKNAFDKLAPIVDEVQGIQLSGLINYTSKAQ